jgi:hypothetical protein
MSVTSSAAAQAAAAVVDRCGQLLFAGDLTPSLVPWMAARQHATLALVNRNCARAVAEHRNRMARFIVKRFRRYQLSPFAYHPVDFYDLGKPDLLVRLRTWVPDLTAANPWTTSSTPPVGFRRVAEPLACDECWGRLDMAFDGLPDPPRPICFVTWRDPDFDYDAKKLIPKLNAGVPIVQEPLADDPEPDPRFINGMTQIFCASNANVRGMTEDSVIAKVNTALGTQFQNVEFAWMDAEARPGAPQLFGSMAHPLWCRDLVERQVFEEDLPPGSTFDSRFGYPGARYTLFSAPGTKPGAHPSVLEADRRRLARVNLTHLNVDA